MMMPNDDTLLTEALLDIAQERKRQVVEEGFTTDHDDFLIGGVLARMGASYARHVANYRGAEYPAPLQHYRDPQFRDEDWPGPWEMWKPSDPRTDLVKAAALILAEIERMDRGVK
jgi:hypothetical protein